MRAQEFVSPQRLPPPQGAGTGECGREAMIRKAAYLLAQWRGFATGPEPRDWLTAARQIDELLRVSRAALGSRSRTRSVADILRSQSART
jgi:Protein of unknown function (DUF2934)